MAERIVAILESDLSMAIATLLTLAIMLWCIR